ncbi:allantoin permease [Pseudonocardia asaccharolytica DSM 44247 = NBRC 16224]|uniref:Allantoin permease n=1 Tax=Pseudonocardia asaccharolytica DSM 44247 = NBRC 16224 TaxID=1123024 RepID=A0A511D2W6_9PSEU|nr:allantoin permease [Pseudonocardia asaccharolytica DSM 44247 = NBRC 16224]
MGDGSTPQIVEEHRDDDFATQVVPAEARLSRGKVHMASWAMLVGMIYLFQGALAATLAGTKQAIIGLLVSAALMALFNMPMVRLGISTGKGSSLASEQVFGKLGRFLIILLLAIATIYFTVFEGSVIAVSFQHYVGGDLRIWYVVAVVGMLPLMMGAVLTWLDKINAVLLPLYVAGVLAAVVLAAMNGNPTGWLEYPGVVPAAAQVIPGWVTTVVIYLGVWLIIPVSNDFSRFGRNEDARYHRWVTFGPVFTTITLVVNGIIGMFVVQSVLPRSEAASEVGVAIALVQLMGVVGLVFIVVTQMRIQTLNFYLSSLNIQRLIQEATGRRVRRKLLVAVVAVVAVVLMLTDVFSYLLQTLQWFGIFFVGWGGIMATCVAFGGMRTNFAPATETTKPRLLTPATAVWLFSAAVGIALLQSAEALPLLAQLAPIISLGIAVVGYLLVVLAQRFTDRAEPGSNGVAVISRGSS